MKNETYVDQLRNTLVELGHIVPAKSFLRSITVSDEDQRQIVVIQGEYLVSLMSQDQSVKRLFDIASAVGGYRCGRWGLRKRKDGRYTLTKLLKRDLSNYVDLVKMIWLRDGLTLALAIVKAGFNLWAALPFKERAKRVDALVLQAQNELRETGLKYSDIAEFFQDSGLAATWVTMLLRTAGRPQESILKMLSAGLSLVEWEAAVSENFGKGLPCQTSEGVH